MRAKWFYAYSYITSTMTRRPRIFKVAAAAEIITNRHVGEPSPGVQSFWLQGCTNFYPQLYQSLRRQSRAKLRGAKPITREPRLARIIFSAFDLPSLVFYQGSGICGVRPPRHPYANKVKERVMPGWTRADALLLIHTPTSYFLKILLDIILPSTSAQALNALYLKLKIKCIYIAFVRSIEFLHIEFCDKFQYMCTLFEFQTSCI